MTRLFITGTDTDVGKTVVTACLAACARRVGPTVAAKPVASGVPAGRSGEDAERLAAAAGHEPRVHSTFVAPVSPHRAARAEGRAVGRGILDWVRDLSAPNVLVEGAGGWRVPIGGGLWMRDLAAATGGPVVIVALDRLGVLNHTLLTVEAVRADGLTVAGVVLNRGAIPRPDDASIATNADDLRELLDVPLAVVGAVGPGAEADAGEAVSAALGVIWSPP